MEILVIILSILCIISCYTSYNLMRKNEKAEDILLSHEDYIKKINYIIEFIDARLKELDAKGTFSSDDEIGFFFERIKMLKELLISNKTDIYEK